MLGRFGLKKKQRSSATPSPVAADVDALQLQRVETILPPSLSLVGTGVVLGAEQPSSSSSSAEGGPSSQKSAKRESDLSLKMQGSKSSLQMLRSVKDSLSMDKSRKMTLAVRTATEVEDEEKGPADAEKPPFASIDVMSQGEVEIQSVVAPAQ